jgi:transcriptional regulator with XRE-family HTH domain
VLKPVHVRLARAAMRWTLADLEAKTGISKNTLVRFEAGGGAHLSTAVKIEEIFTKAGISFIYEDEKRGSGVLLSKELSRSLGDTPRAPTNGRATRRKAKTK